MPFPKLNVLYCYTSTFRSKSAVPGMAFVSIVLMSCVPGLFLRYFLKDFEMGPVAPIVTGITLLLLLLLLLLQ